ncbi:MAG: HPt (histidine-containing phosphotransfer) domain-containing protein [Planctomycetota bacterium]|jgi:HPt (histidine-containing phosphotransfer) domain-containing protein
MTDSDDRILDMEVIEALRALEAEGAPGLFDELVELFLSDTPPRMKSLAEATAAGDMKAVEFNAHSLKSSCGNLGATILVDLFREIERLGREEELDGVSVLVNRSAEEFDRVQVALSAA